MPFLRRTHGPSSPRPIISAGGGDAVAALGALLSLCAALAAYFGDRWWAIGSALAAAAITTLAYRRSRQTILTDAELDELRTAEEALAAAPDPEHAGRTLAVAAQHLVGAASATVVIQGIGPPVRMRAGRDLPELDGDYGPSGRVRLLHHAGVNFGSVGVSRREDGAGYTSRHERVLDVLAERASATLRQLALIDDVEVERQTLADLVTSSSEGIFAIDDNKKVMSWNPAMAGITGVSPEVALDAPLAQSFPAMTVGGTAWPGPAAAAADPTAAPELLWFDRGGETRWAVCTCARLRRGGHVVIVRDETEARKIAAEKQSWISQVSHELRTPLTPIKGFVQTLIRRNDTLTSEERIRILGIMLREEQRLEDLVNSLLRSSRLDEASLALHVDRIDWGVIVHEQVELYRRQDPARAIEVRVPDHLPRALADANVGAGVLGNLLSNALKYSPGPIGVSVEVDAGEIITSVADHGPGVAPEDRGRVFERFTRLGDHLTNKEQGVGLGLYIARESVARLDGEMWIDDTPGGGATFRFTLPVASPVRTP